MQVRVWSLGSSLHKTAYNTIKANALSLTWVEIVDWQTELLTSLELIKQVITRFAKDISI